MVDVVGVGGAVLDHLINVDQVPAGKDGGARVHEMFLQGGGNVATAMAAAARLGAKAGMLAKVGSDFAGDYIIKDFNYNGVDTSRMIRGAPDTTSPYVVAVSEKVSNTRFFMGRGSTIERLQPEELDKEYIAGAKILHVDHGGPTPTAAAEYARSQGLQVTIDAGYYSQDRVDIIPLVHVYIASEMFYDGMFPDSKDKLEDNCRKLHDMGPEVVWVTLGERGCVGLVDGKFHTLPAFKIPEVVDTVGAGDVFHGAYVAAMLEGLPPVECARYSSAVSALKCMYVGGRTGIPNRETLRRFMEEGVIDRTELDARLEYYRKDFLATR
ncbi:MAG: carbohydrate kinase family protein [Treponema sp.]|nr:carbohydrate kinase family protein [Treponema sp.]